MAATSYYWFDYLQDFMNKNSDPRTKGLLFMDSPVPFITFSICYLYFVCKAGPQYMKDKKPYNLKAIITVYNIFQISSCIYLIYSMLSFGSLGMFECDQNNTSMDSKRYQIAKLVWWTTILKLTEYLETVFFVLRKKQNQVSGLHLYHHVSTLSLAWLTSKFRPGTPYDLNKMFAAHLRSAYNTKGVEVVAPIVLNSFVHVLMYSYYLIALLGGRNIQKKIVFWKRSLTILQMVQFTIIIIHLLSGFKGHCSGPVFLLYLTLINVFVNYFLFYRFYRNTYKKIK